MLCLHEEPMMRRHATHLLSHLAVTGVLGSAVITDFSVIWPNRQGEGSGEIKKSTETMMGQDLLILERKLKGIYVGNETTVCEGRATPYPHFHREAGESVHQQMVTFNDCAVATLTTEQIPVRSEKESS